MHLHDYNFFQLSLVYYTLFDNKGNPSYLVYVNIQSNGERMVQIHILYQFVSIILFFIFFVVDGRVQNWTNDDSNGDTGLLFAPKRLRAPRIGQLPR